MPIRTRGLSCVFTCDFKCRILELGLHIIGEATITVSFEENTPTGLFDFVAETKTPVRVQYVNMLGQKSDTPFSGMNVVITTYTDGSHSTAKRAY